VSAHNVGVIAQAVVPVFVYSLPMLVALILPKRRWVAVGFITMFLGWTIIGWIIALVLAFTWRRRPPVVWDGVHTMTVGHAGGTLALWVTRCTCGWQTSSFRRDDVVAAANILPHPPSRQPYYAGPG
jgi:Na+/melibiose symporter-like transporter